MSRQHHQLVLLRQLQRSQPWLELLRQAGVGQEVAGFMVATLVLLQPLKSLLLLQPV